MGEPRLLVQKKSQANFSRAGMRFEPEVSFSHSSMEQADNQSVDPANAGLHHAISFLLPIQAANPWLTHSDLWSTSAFYP
jgi:hypothetical protein